MGPIWGAHWHCLAARVHFLQSNCSYVVGSFIGCGSSFTVCVCILVVTLWLSVVAVVRWSGNLKSKQGNEFPKSGLSRVEHILAEYIKLFVLRHLVRGGWVHACTEYTQAHRGFRTKVRLYLSSAIFSDI